MIWKQKKSNKSKNQKHWNGSVICWANFISKSNQSLQDQDYYPQESTVGL